MKENQLLVNGPISIESYADNLKEKLQVCQLLLRSGILPSHYKSEAAVLTAILYGKELGFSPIRALNSINIIQGKPVLSAEGLKALAIKEGAKIKTVEWDDKVCTLQCARSADWVETFTYSLEDARRQELLSKENWRKMPKQMLYARCVSILVRNMFTDVIAGLYSIEEMEDARQEIPLSKKAAPINVIVADELPESFNRPPPSEAVATQDAIDGEDILALGAHLITTKCSFQGQSVREIVKQAPEKVLEFINKFNDIDKPAITAYMDAIGL